MQVRELSAGDHFGEEALLQNHHHDATITAKTDVSCFVLERRDFAAVRYISRHLLLWFEFRC